MKICFLILFVALLGAQTTDALSKQSKTEPDCSQYDDGETIPDRSSCSKYYLCVGGKALAKRCAFGLYYDTMSGLCNRAFLVDCNLNRLGASIDDIINSRPNVEFELHIGNDNEEKPMPQAVAATTPCITTPTPCTTPTTPCTTKTTTCTTTKTTTCITTKTTTCTTTKTTTCTTTKTTTCTTTKTTTCTTTKTTTCTTTKTTTCSTTTTCTPTKPPCTPTKPPATTNTTCTQTKPPCTPTKPPATTKTTCTPTKPPCTPTKPPCTTKTTCTITKPPCTTTTVCAPVETNTNTIALKFHATAKDCVSLPDDTIILDYNHCRRYYKCSNGRTKRKTCPAGQWLDQETLSCLSRSIAKCAAGRS